MKCYIKNLMFAAIIAAGFASCNNDKLEHVVDNDSNIEIIASQTRAHDASWDNNDEIGVYMNKAGETEAISENVKYTTRHGNGSFSTDQTMKFPKEGNVDILAYYPYAKIANGIYEINLADQADQKKIDLLWASSKNLDNSSNKVQLTFKHMLTELDFEIVGKDNKNIPASDIKIFLKEMPATAEFNLADGTISKEGAKQDIAMKMSDGKAHAFIIPQPDAKSFRIRLEYKDGKKHTQLIKLSSKAFSAGNKYTQTLTLKNIAGQEGGGEEGGDVEVSDGKISKCLEIPLFTNKQQNNDNLMFVMHGINNDNTRNYTMLFDKKYNMAYWVAYPLCNYYTRKKTDRTNAWRYDPKIPTQYQYNMSSGLGGGYDRGHQIPSADRVGSREMNVQTFYYSNMTAQVGKKMNRGIWERLERGVRGWASNKDTLYVVTGAMPYEHLGEELRYHKGHVVPKYYFKALMFKNKKTGGAETIGFRMENENYSHTNYMKCKKSVAEIERMTGFTFFPTVKKEDKERISSYY